MEEKTNKWNKEEEEEAEKQNSGRNRREGRGRGRRKIWKKRGRAGIRRKKTEEEED